jgi:predicted ATPase
VNRARFICPSFKGRTLNPRGGKSQWQVNGYLNLSLNFNKTLTFLTGINGSGKTSSLNAIVALISPDLRMLANLEYKRISLDFNNNSKKYTVSAQTANDVITLSTSTSSHPYVFQRYMSDPDTPNARQLDLEAQHYKEALTAGQNHPVLRFIEELPTPMFLGLDRRSRYDDDVHKRNRIVYGGALRTTRNLFSSSLGNSLRDTEEIATTAYRDALIRTGRNAESLQNELILTLLSEERLDQRTFGSLVVPTEGDLKDLKAVRRDMDNLPRILRIPPKEVQARVFPLLDALRNYAANIPKDVNVSEIAHTETSNSPLLDALFGWSVNQGALKKFKAISTIISLYNSQRSELLRPTEKYLELMNSFLHDGGKRIEFNDRGYMSVRIDGVSGEKSISYLSSGEAQIFVILTHLAFNALAQNNVFIIDEPELSLHVHWQEMFVDSILSSNPDIQYVLATHSPSIILERTELCVDLSKRSGRLIERARK